MEIRNDYLEKNHNKESIYSEMITRNQLKNPWWTSGSSDWVTNSGSVEFNEDDTGFMNLTVDSNISSQVKQLTILKPKHRYFITFDVKVTRYTKGLFGIHISGKIPSKSSNHGLQRLSKNKEYETIIGTFSTENDQIKKHCIFVGSIGGASGAGSIRKLSLYDLTELYGEGNEPTAQEFYSSIPGNQNELGIQATLSQAYSLLDVKVNQLRKTSISVTDEEARNVFIKEMNRKANDLDMSNTFFKNVQGFRMAGHMSTTRDFLKLGLHVLGHEEILKIWGIRHYSVDIRGKKARKETIETTLRDSFLEDNYSLLGGKTGAILDQTLSVLTLVADQEGSLYLSVVMGASGPTGDTDRFEAVHQLISHSKKRTDNPEFITMDSFKAAAGSVLKLPHGNPLYYSSNTPTSTFSINEEVLHVPASLTKLMTALLAIEHINNLNEVVTVTSSDISGGSGPMMYEGDQLSIRDALNLLLLSSSNTAAKLLSRIAGQRMVQVRGYVD